MPQTGLLRNRAFSRVVNIAELIENEAKITIGRACRLVASPPPTMKNAHAGVPP